MLPEFTKYLDMEYSCGIIDRLNEFASNPVLGYRTSGSAAEIAAGEFLYNELRSIGLKNVHKDPVTVDNFEFKRADISYIMPNGNRKTIVLSAFQARCFAEDEEIKVVYAGRGTEKDYENLDVTGKYVLVDINMVDDWFIYWAVGQAASKKAAGIIVVQVDGYCSHSEDTLGVQDISTSADLPTFSMTVREANTFKKHIKELGGEVTAVLNADVRITNKGITHNIVGEIPGSTKEVIYLIAHYDGYFRAYADNASGVGAALGITRAFVKSGYKPKRTIRVIFHGAEEWGLEGSRYDWACGATKEIEKHPEWSENGFFLINLDGWMISSEAEGTAVRTSYELAREIEKVGQSIEGNIYPFRTITPLWTWTESYMYAKKGIPTMDSWYDGEDIWPSYHSTSDTREVNHYSDEAYRSSHILYGTLLQRLDDMKVRPFNFADLFDKLNESLDEDVTGDTEGLKEAVKEAYSAAASLKGKEDALSGDEEIYKYNSALSKIFSKITDELFGLDWYEKYDFIHVRNRNNIRGIKNTLEAIEESDFEKAYEEFRAVDLSWYAYNFDRETYDYFVDQVIGKNAPETWASGKVGSIGDFYEAAKAIAKAKEEHVAPGEEIIGKLKSELKIQEDEIKEKVQREISIVKELTDLINKA